jgi:pyruvate/2-oxoglutarate/acetoin dehydrogenase E1 component
MRGALQLALRDAMEGDPDVFLIGEDIADPLGGSFRITHGLSTRFGTDRVRNTPISEGAIVGAAIGAALAGKRPVAEIMYADFLTLAMDQLVNQAAFLHYVSGGRVPVPLVIRCQGGAGLSQGAQHSKSLESWIAHVPGLKMVTPSTPHEAYWLLRAAIEDDDPVIFFESASLYESRGVLDASTPPDRLGSSAIRRQGMHATLVSWGAMMPAVLWAADRLETDGILVEVLDLRHLAPLPLEDVLASVRRTGLLAIVHEAWQMMGLGAEIAASVADAGFDVLEGPILRIGALPCPHPFAPALERAMIPTEEHITRAIRGWFQSQPS